MINYTEKGWMLHTAINNAGYKLKANTNDEAYDEFGNQSAAIDTAVQAIIDAYDPLPLAKSEAKARILKQSQVAADKLIAKYPQFERELWDIQAREAREWQANSNAATPRINKMAAQRGRDRVEQLNSVVSHETDTIDALAVYAGERQRLEDIIDNSTDLAVIEGINFVAPEV